MERRAVYDAERQLSVRNRAVRTRRTGHPDWALRLSRVRRRIGLINMTSILHVVFERTFICATGDRNAARLDLLNNISTTARNRALDIFLGPRCFASLRAYFEVTAGLICQRESRSSILEMNSLNVGDVLAVL